MGATIGQNGWKRRLFFSVVYAIVAVLVSSIAVVSLSSLESPAGSRQNGAIEISTDIVGVPLAAGWYFVSLVFGEWRAVHQGQIALVPPISILIDALFIFAVWEFIHRKRSRELVSSDILRIGR